MLAWLGGKRRRNRLKAAAEARAARSTVSSGWMPSGTGRLPAPLQHRSARLQEDSPAKEATGGTTQSEPSCAEALISRTSSRSNTYKDGDPDARAEPTATKQQRLTQKSSFSGAWASVSLGNGGNDAGRTHSQPLASLDQRAIAMSDSEDESCDL